MFPVSWCDRLDIKAKDLCARCSAYLASMRSMIMPPRMTTRSASRSTAALRGGGTGGRVGRGARRTREPVGRNNETIGELDGQGNDRGVGANGGVGGVTPPNRVPSNLAPEGVTSLNISSTKHKERPLRVTHASASLTRACLTVGS
ncbi:hypothetical protein Tco_0577464 [Tanacetum coccineum]